MTTMADLFEPEPRQWGLRGDPYCWAAMRDRLGHQPIPETDAARTLRQAFEDVVGVALDTPRDRDMVSVPQFNHGGMSGGLVHLPTWTDRLLPLLVNRAAEAARGRSWIGDPDDEAMLRTQG